MGPCRHAIPRSSSSRRCRSSERAQLGKVAGLAEEASYNAGRVLVKKGDPGKAFYVSVEGKAKVVKGKIVTARREAELGPASSSASSRCWTASPGRRR